MFCHAGPFPPDCRCGPPPGLQRGFRRRGSVSVMRASFQAEGGTFRAGGRGRGRAFRTGAVRAPDCPRETAHAPRPSVPAGVFFAAPAIAFCRKAERRPQRAASLSALILHQTGESQAPLETKSENIGQFSHSPLNRLDNRRLSLHPKPRAGDSRRRRSKRCSMKAVPSAGAARLTNGTVIIQATTMPESHIR